MEAKQHSIEVPQQLRYFTIGKLSHQTPAIWMVCHGYGQLASYFIRHFQLLADAGHFIIAPEGLSRFYLEGVSGRVGASWMTKEERQADIRNYIDYLTAVYKAASKDLQISLYLLGFSQGASTVSRLAMLSDLPFRKLILWAGAFPADLPFALSAARLREKQLYLVYGDQDPYISVEKLKEQLQLFKSMELPVKKLSFNGKHEINQEILKSYFLK